MCSNNTDNTKNTGNSTGNKKLTKEERLKNMLDSAYEAQILEAVCQRLLRAALILAPDTPEREIVLDCYNASMFGYNKAYTQAIILLCQQMIGFIQIPSDERESTLIESFRIEANRPGAWDNFTPYPVDS